MTITDIYFQNVQAQAMTKPKTEIVLKAGENYDFSDYLNNLQLTESHIKNAGKMRSDNSPEAVNAVFDKKTAADYSPKSADFKRDASSKNISNKSIVNKSTANKSVSSKSVSGKSVSNKSVSNKSVSNISDSDRIAADKSVSEKSGPENVTPENLSGKDISGNEAEAVNSKKELTKKGFSEDDFDAACKDIIDKLAIALNIPAESIQIVLIDLNVKPLALMDDSNLDSFAQKLTEISAEHPNIPPEPEVFEKVKGIMEDYKEIAQNFIQKLEEDSIGVPKFIDSGYRQTIIASMDHQDKSALLKNESPETEALNVSDETPAQYLSESGPETQIQATGRILSENGSNSENQGGYTFADRKGTEILQNEVSESDPQKSAGEINFQQFSIKTDDIGISQNKNESVKNVDTQEVINQIVDKIKVEVKSDVSTEIKLTLKPEHLGDVSMKIQTQNGIVTAQFIAESQRVKEVIEAGFDQLRESLQEQGVNISQLSVSVGQENANERQSWRTQQDSQNNGKSGGISSGSVQASNETTETSGMNPAAYMHDDEVYDIKVDYMA